MTFMIWRSGGRDWRDWRLCFQIFFFFLRISNHGLCNSTITATIFYMSRRVPRLRAHSPSLRFTLPDRPLTRFTTIPMIFDTLATLADVTAQQQRNQTRQPLGHNLRTTAFLSFIYFHFSGFFPVNLYVVISIHICASCCTTIFLHGYDLPDLPPVRIHV